MIDLGKAYGRKPSETEAARPRNVSNRLRISGKTTLLIANGSDGTSAHLTLPEKIAGASRTIMDGMAAVAEKTAAIQAHR